MKYRTRLKQFVMLTGVMWLATLVVVVGLTYNYTSVALTLVFLVVMLASMGTAMMVFNFSQLELAENQKKHSQTKRLVQEQQLKLDRHEYDAKKLHQLRRIVLNSAQEKDYALLSMANALTGGMNRIQGVAGALDESSKTEIVEQAEQMKLYAMDLESLAKLALKQELPDYQQLDFVQHLSKLIEQWQGFAASRKIKIVLDNPEEQMPIMSDVHWLDNLLTRTVHALVRMNFETKLVIHLIGYQDAELGDALRLRFAIDGRKLSDEQLKRLTAEYVSIDENGRDVGPGLMFVVIRRVAQLLGGTVEVSTTESGTETLLVLPRNPLYADQDDDE